MKISAHFSDIQSCITQELNEAQIYIVVAVAWITDKSLWNILIKKALEGVNVEVILVQDETNKKYLPEIIDFIKSGGNLFWDDHHHKFCVIDMKTIITGSYNWTNMANFRGKRENIIIIKDDSENGRKFSEEFKLLRMQSTKHQLPVEKEVLILEKQIEVEKKVEIEVIKEVEKRPIPYFKSGKYYCGKCHNRMRPVKSPKHMVGLAFQSCKDCKIYINEKGQIV
jgi:phosphatidylserine/phosphatidylglycerophosphate/cardiolipin synthase-like enzyme